MKLTSELIIYSINCINCIKGGNHTVECDEQRASTATGTQQLIPYNAVINTQQAQKRWELIKIM